MAERSFVKIQIGAGKGAIEKLTVPSSLPPLKKDSKPVIVNELTVKNAGDIKDRIVAVILEAESDGSRIKDLWGSWVDLDPGKTYTWKDIKAGKGLSKDYPSGSTLYLCVIVFALKEPSKPKDCKGMTAKAGGARFVGIPIMEKPERNYIKAAAGAFGAAMTVLPLMLRRW